MAEPRPGNFQSCCRLCLREKMDTSKSVFGEAAEDRMLRQKILQCVAIESLQIKEEPMNDAEDNSCERSENDQADVLVKSEPVEPTDEHMEEEYNELPPPLTPHPPAGTDSENSQDSQEGNNADAGTTNNRLCNVCDKLFSSVSNRRKHEKQMHGLHQCSSVPEIGNKRSLTSEAPGTDKLDDPHIEANAQTITEKNSVEPPTPEQQKIQFAAGLKLLQKNSTPISCEPLSKIEMSYIEKCKAMVNMHRTLECACHKVMHPNLKGLLSHLRALRIWFPVFTCYNCMITFTDRSTFTRHTVRCPKGSLETIVKLSNLKKRSEVKTRLYQNFKCTACKFMYSFHDDFCKHVDEDHSVFQPPVTCSCGRVFDNLEDYRDHVYVSCLVEYYCDICFITTKTLDDFQKHSVAIHDNSEGFILLQDDNYTKRKSVSAPPPKPKPELPPQENVIVTGKRERRMSVKAPILEPDEDEDVPKKKINPQILASGSKVCPLCSKEYSSHNNMIRHYKTHLDVSPLKPSENEEAFYSCPECGGMYNTTEWQRHLEEKHEPKTCGECGKIFQFQTELDQHRSVHLNLKVYRDSKTQSYKTSMLSPGSEGEVMLMCEMCDVIFATKEELKQHKLIHENGIPILEPAGEETEVKEGKYSCKPCNKVYATYGGIWDHNKKKHPEKKSPHMNEFPKQCPLCDKVCGTGAAYYRHKQIHETQRINSDNADVTPSKTPIVKNKNEEEEESYHTCKRCFKVFSSKYNLKNHMKSHGMSATSKKVVKKAWCEICHQSFSSNEAMLKHKEEHKTEELPNPVANEPKVPFIFTCDVCVMTFTTKIALKKHKEKHAQETKQKNPVYCKYCKIAFDSVALLTKHMHVEHDETAKPRVVKEKPKQFICTICKKNFQTAAALSTHMGWHKRSPHGGTESKPAKMLKQNKITSKLVNNLVKQEPIETPEFQCVTCLAEFPNDTALQVHILEKHRSVSAIMLIPRCNTCNKDFSNQDEYETHKRLHDFLERQKQHELLMQQEASEQSGGSPKPLAAQPKFNKGFPCKYCNAAFSRADTLSGHIRQYHKEFVQSDFKCTQCDRVFDKQNSLSIHLKVHEKQKTTASVPSKPPIKPVSKPASKPVSKPVSKPASKPANKPVIKPVSKPLFSCSICSMGFDLPKDLRAHTINAHPF